MDVVLIPLLVETGCDIGFDSLAKMDEKGKDGQNDKSKDKNCSFLLFSIEVLPNRQIVWSSPTWFPCAVKFYPEQPMKWHRWKQ